MLLRKQSDKSMTWAVDLDFVPDKETYEAGAVAFWNSFCYLSIGIRKNKNGDKLVVITMPVDGQGKFDTKKEVLSDGFKKSTRLEIRCTSMSYTVGYVEESGFHGLSTVATEIMTLPPPLGMAYTGVMLGIYAFGEMEPCLSPADFSNISLEYTC